MYIVVCLGRDGAALPPCIDGFLRCGVTLKYKRLSANVMSARWRRSAEQRIPFEGIGAEAMAIENGTEKALSRHINK